MTHRNTRGKFVPVFAAALTIWILIPAPGSAAVLHNHGTVVNASGSSSAQNAQAASARLITGTVLDPSGGAIAGAHVILVSEDGKEIAHTLTDSEGNFNFEEISAGSYTVYAQAACFSENRIGIKLGAKTPPQVRLVLKVRLVPPNASQTRIRLGTLLPQGSSQYRVLEKMGQDWRCATNGGVTLTIYGGGSMGSEIDSVRRMRVGELQAATLSVGGLSKIDPGVSALQKIPMLYHSLDEEEYVRGKMAAEMERRLEQKGFVVLNWGDAGWVHIFSRQAILRPDDLKKAKLFVTADDPDEAEIIKDLRLQPVPLEWSDVLISLQTGLVDTVPTIPFLCLAGQYDLPAKHMLPLNYVVLVGATVMTKKSWDALAPADREAMRKIAAEAGKQMQIKSRAENITAIEAMKKRGLQVHPLSPGLEAEWRQFLEGVYPKVRGTMVPADMFDQIQHLIADYRTGHKAGR